MVGKYSMLPGSWHTRITENILGSGLQGTNLTSPTFGEHCPSRFRIIHIHFQGNGTWTKIENMRSQRASLCKFQRNKIMPRMFSGFSGIKLKSVPERKSENFQISENRAVCSGQFRNQIREDTLDSHTRQQKKPSETQYMLCKFRDAKRYSPQHALLPRRLGDRLWVGQCSRSWFLYVTWQITINFHLQHVHLTMFLFKANIF